MKKKLIVFGIIAVAVLAVVIGISLFSREDASSAPPVDRKQLRKTLRIHPSQLKLNRELVNDALREKFKKEGIPPANEERPE
ncbi:MAG TPA: hypothetical protein PKH10_10630 [bacterium]|nr:hypothetical protein [bacterium]